MDVKLGPVKMTVPAVGQHGPWRTLVSLPKAGTVVLRLHDGSEQTMDVKKIASLDEYTSWRPED